MASPIAAFPLRVVQHGADSDCRAYPCSTDRYAGTYTSARVHPPALVNTDTYTDGTGASTNAHIDPAPSGSATCSTSNRPG